MTNKHLKNCSTSLVREMKIKTIKKHTIKTWDADKIFVKVDKIFHA